MDDTSMGMQELQLQISASIEEYFENYDWDTKFKKYLEEQ
jgi:hypothetical protein